MPSRACRKPIYYSFVTVGVVAFTVMSFYAYSAANFGALCQEQYMGYTYTVVSNVVLMTAAFFASLVMWGDDWLYKCVLFNILVSITGFGLSITSIAYLNQDCTKESFKKYRFPRAGNDTNGALDELQREGRCCGIDNYTDYMVSKTAWHVPKSCCSPPKPDQQGDTTCGMNNGKAEYTRGCIQDTFEQLKNTAPKFYMHNQIVKHLTIITLFLYIIFIGSLIFYLWMYGRAKYQNWLQTGRLPACLRDSCPCAASKSLTDLEDAEPEPEPEADSVDFADVPQQSGSKLELNSSETSTDLLASGSLESTDTIGASGSTIDTQDRSKERLVRFSETLIVYPYNADDRFTAIPVDDEGNPLPVDRNCPARPGYRYTTAPLKTAGSRKPVPRSHKRTRTRRQPVNEDYENDDEPQKEEFEEEMEAELEVESETDFEAEAQDEEEV